MSQPIAIPVKFWDSVNQYSPESGVKAQWLGKITESYFGVFSETEYRANYTYENPQRNIYLIDCTGNSATKSNFLRKMYGEPSRSSAARCVKQALVILSMLTILIPLMMLAGKSIFRQCNNRFIAHQVDISEVKSTREKFNSLT